MFALLALFACRGPVVVPAVDSQPRHPTEWVAAEPEDEDTGWTLPSGDGPALELWEAPRDEPDVHGGEDVSYLDSDYLFRAAITMIHQGNGDVTITVPPDWDEFWENIQADGDDIRVTLGDGITPVDYQWASYTYATRTGVIELDGFGNFAGIPYAQMGWLYFGNSAATDGSASFTASTPEDGFIHLGAPAGIVFDLVEDSPGATVPAQEMAKTTTAETHVWWRLSGLESRVAPYNLHTEMEEPVGVIAAAVLSSGSAQASMVDNDGLRWVRTNDGSIYLRQVVKAGSDATNYTLAVTVVVTPRGWGATDNKPRTLTGRALLRVNDPAEP